MCVGAYPGGQFEDVWEENKKSQIHRTVRIGYVIEILGMDEVIELVSGNHLLLREHQDLLKWAQHILAARGAEKIDIRIFWEMHERFVDFVGYVNSILTSSCSPEDKLFLEISVFPK